MGTDIEGLLNDGMRVAREGRWDDARNLFFEVAAQNPGNLDVWLWLGAIAEDPQDSIACLERALEINPKSIRAQKGLEWARERIADVGPSGQAQGGSGRSSIIPSTPAAEPTSDHSPTSEALELPFETATPTSAPAEDPSQYSSTEVGEGETSGIDLASLFGESKFALDGTTVPETDETEWKNWNAGGSPPEESGFGVATPFGPLDTGGQDANESRSDISPDLGFEESLRAFLRSDSTPTEPSFGEVFPPAEEPSVDSGGSVSSDSTASEETPFLTESWENIIAKLRALDEQLETEESAPPPGEVAEDAISEESVTSEGSAADSPIGLSEPPIEQAYIDSQSEEYPDEAVSFSPESETVPPSAVVSADELVGAGKRDLELGQVADAIASFKSALELNPRHVEAWEQLGVAEYQMGNLDGAVAAFENVAGLEPDRAEAYANMGFLFAEQGRVEDAIDSFRQALRCNSELVEAHVNLANIFRAQGKVDEAVEAWSAAAQIRPDLPDVHVNLGEVYAERNQLGEAVWEFRLAVDYMPTDARAHLRLGQLLFQVGRSSDAEGEFVEALKYSPDLAEARYGLASCFEEQGNLDEAIAELERALAAKPGYAEAEERLGRLRAMVAGRNVVQSEEVVEEQKKKSRWSFFKRDKN